jgi:hypothetical protein
MADSLHDESQHHERQGEVCPGQQRQISFDLGCAVFVIGDFLLRRALSGGAS